VSDHVLKLKRRSIPVWIYTTVWKFPIENADFCKLFWATLLAPVGLYMWLLGRLLPKSIAKGYQLAAGTKVLSGVGVAGDRVAAFFQRHDEAVLITAMVACVLALVGVGVWWALTYFESFWIAIAGAAVVIVVVVCIASTPLGRFLGIGVRAVKSRTCPRVEIES
jgi:hypothetical protein